MNKIKRLFLSFLASEGFGILALIFIYSSAMCAMALFIYLIFHVLLGAK